MKLVPQILNGFNDYGNVTTGSDRRRRILGSYERTKFVLRLAPEVHDILSRSDVMPGEVRLSSADAELAQAMSTYLHETIHWWQHIGSFAGFIQTNTFPAGVHVNHDKLLTILKTHGPRKSLYKLLEAEASKSDSLRIDLLNIVVNNMKDLDFFVAATQDPSNLSIIGDSPFFEGRGHAFVITYLALMSSLSNFDAGFSRLPDPAGWEEALTKMKHSRAPEYYYGSVIRRPPIGLIAIFEGQARFSQMQYLYYGSGESLMWQDFDEVGMLGDIYVEAFNLFLNIVDIEPPKDMGSPIIALFLLICDLAVNPTDGFPLPIRSFGAFVDDVDPGTRFLRLCRAAKAEPTVLTEVTRFTREEYLTVATRLCKIADLTPPHEALLQIAEWGQRCPEIEKVIEEGQTFEFGLVNMPLRLLLSRFLLFCRDKERYPEFFCWPGAGMTSAHLHDKGAALFQNHQSLFTDRSDRRGIFPRLVNGIDPKKSAHTLDVFYSWNAIYDITRQWIAEEGVFDLAFDWLSDGSNEDIYQWANSVFFDTFGVRPEDFEVL